MELIKNSTCSQIILKSEYIDDFVNAPEPNHLTIKLFKNCEMIKEIVFEAIMYNAMIGIEGLLLTPESFNLSSETLPDGIYSVEIVDRNEERIIKDFSCITLLCEARCDVIEHVSKNLNSTAYAIFKVLEFVDTCTDCNCEHGCVLFDELQRLLNGDNKLKPCGNC